MISTQYYERFGQEIITFYDTGESFTFLWGQWVSMLTWKPIVYEETAVLLNSLLLRYQNARRTLGG